jgi:hypothetical protein
MTKATKTQVNIVTDNLSRKADDLSACMTSREVWACIGESERALMEATRVKDLGMNKAASEQCGRSFKVAFDRLENSIRSAMDRAELLEKREQKVAA